MMRRLIGENVYAPHVFTLAPIGYSLVRPGYAVIGPGRIHAGPEVDSRTTVYLLPDDDGIWFRRMTKHVREEEYEWPIR